MDLTEVAVGARMECADCGELLVRMTRTDRHKYSDDKLIDFAEVASGDSHECWKQLPENAEHLRLNP